jgi:segregation and condensation protein B
MRTAGDAPGGLAPVSLRQVVGALVFGSSGGLSVEAIRGCLRETAAEAEGGTAPSFAEIAPADIRAALLDIQKDLDRLDIGIELREIAGGFRFQTQPACGRWVRRLLRQAAPSRLSPAALETLAIIAYRQPVARSELEGIRGVSVDHAIKALTELRLIRVTGRSDLPGRPFLYGTTSRFLEHFGLKSLDELGEIDPTLQRAARASRRPSSAGGAVAAAPAEESAAPAGGEAER